MTARDETTIDSIFGGSLEIEQPATGYRFNTDSVFLASHLRERDLSGRLLDAGAGVGLLGLAIAKKHVQLHVDCVEIQHSFVELCERNAFRNGVADRVDCHHADIREFARDTLERYDTVVVNPPYYSAGRGRLGASASKNVARHQLHGSLKDWLDALQSVMQPDGLLAIIYPARFLPSLLRDLQNSGLRAHYLRSIHATLASPATTVILEASISTAERELCMDPPLVIKQAEAYTDETRRLLQLTDEVS